MAHDNKNENKNEDSHNWGYENDEPYEWPKYYKTGEQQSPINILISKQQQQEDDTFTSTCCIANSKLEKLRLDSSKRRAHLDSHGEEQTNERCESAADSHLESSQHSNSTDDSVNEDSADDEDDDDDDDGNNEDSEGNSSHKQNKAHVNKLHQLQHHRQKQQQQQQQNTRFCSTNKKIFLGYPRYLAVMELCNTGHGWQVNLPKELTDHTLVAGPPLGDREYKLAQLHCHWGEDCEHGSEHQINGKSFAAEIHFVHWNCTDFESLEEAAKHRHGLAVLGVFVQALQGEQHRNRHLDKIIAGLKRIQRPGSSVRVESRLDLKKLFPANRNEYASYEGSLTTPPLSEVVDWVIFLNPIQASESQIDQFRQMRCGNSGQKILRKNCRPVQPLNRRLVSIWTHQHSNNNNHHHHHHHL